ncbi:MAG: hypothetical protein EOM69_07050 [Clostridia bacterium]|nr:hypothetical protein [Clostridia bacterium]
MVKENLAKLLEVKSIVTILMTGALVGLLVSGAEVQRELLMLFSTSYGAVITYFFTRKDGAPK